MARDDLTVMGGGIAGLSVAWEAARRGMRVRLVEAVAIGAGASGGLVGALAPHAPEQWNAAKAFQLEALLMAEAHWAEVASVSGRSPGYAKTGRLQPLAPEAVDLARLRGEEAETLWQGRARWQVVPARGGAFEPVSASGFLVHDTLTARVSPRGALAALAGAVQARGGRVEIGAAEPEGTVVWATGHRGLEALGADLCRKAGQGVKGQALALALPGVADLPQVYANGVHVVPHEDGTVAIGSTSENAYDHAATDGQADDLLARARALVPALAAAPEVERWAGIRPRAQSRAPLIGAWPGRPGHWICNGGFKIGFAVAPLAARLILDAIEGQDAIPAAFRP